ncbi:MAG: histidine kinase, partial [Bacteroidales bacterium]|nr:histidine kinase [Bacteroidales bacterium]
NGKNITLIATNRGILAYNANTKIFLALGLNKKIVNLVYDVSYDCFWLFSSNKVFRVNNLRQGIQFVGKLKTTINLETSSLRCDKTGSIWCIQDKNVYLFDSAKLQFVQIGSSLDFPNIIQNCIANCLDGIVLSTREGLLHVNSKTRQFKPLLSSPKDSLILENTSSIAMIDSSKLFLVSNYGFYFYHLKEMILKKIQLNSIPPDFSYSIEALVAAGDKIYIASNHKIYEMNISQNSIQQINIHDRHMVSSRLTTCLLEDKEGYIWIGTSDNGLNRLNPRTGLFDHFFKGNTPHSLPSEDVTCLYCCSRNKIWIGTNNGLCQYNQRDSTIVPILPDVITGRVESIIESPDSLIWIGLQHGLVRIDPTLQKWQLFNEADGLPTSSFNHGAFNLAPDRLAFATKSGVITINPKTFLGKSNFYPILITDFKIPNQVISYAIHQNDTITLKHNENSFSISFSPLTFDKVGVNQFSYTITGMKGSWVTTTSNFASFTNLNPGQYIFRVTRKGFENNTDKHTLLKIVIKPPFWKTIGFRSSILIVLISIGSFILMLYINQLKARESSVVLEQKLLASQMNPHFIFNTLSAIQNYIYNKDSEDAGNYLANFSMLVRLILENSRAEWITIDQEIKTIKLYLILQQLRFPNKFEYEIDVDPIINKKFLNIPPMLVQPFIENSIEHGIMHKKTMGNILIIFKLVDELIQIEVIDDGIGLKKSEMINRNREQHTSLATQITRERLSNLKRKFNERIGITVCDREEVEGKNGVRVTLFVPYKKSFFRNS